MAIPVHFPSDMFTIEKSEYEFYKLLFMLTVVIATTTIFCAFTIQESLYDNDEEEQDKTKNVKNKNKTPTKRSAKQNKKCPNAPKAKRHCAINSPTLQSLTPRELFPDETDETDETEETDKCGKTPNAPIKFKKIENPNISFNHDIKRELFVFKAGENDELDTPDAPKKNKNTERKIAELNDFDKKELDFDEKVEFSPKEYLSLPSNDEFMSKESEFIFSLYNPTTSIEELVDEVNRNADKIDFSNPDRLVWSFNPAGITSYILIINHIYKAIRAININNYALPHSGNGKSSTRNSPEGYKLIDKLFNTCITIQYLNINLSDKLLTVYDNCSHSWLSIPNSYVQACKLNKDAYILQKMLFNEVCYNMNLTEWSEW